MADLTFGAHVTPVKDLDRATKFYTEALGLTVKTKEETGAILGR
ncbi:MAG: VOC family protein [Pseudomonadales bacterium]|jgi:catechol-2,3-dioxygenase|nr:VOC family protein [Pseudomonadales bacterium]MDP6315330.1 VOC family protein [Pseudomonadales bacterium]MDP7314778.1 VOC family protein [Pseudomonadales bacterium]|tara:strand:+ start:240 stop:371 length:132 start_codon:yes stop_codon:yes gene_type:complete